MHLMAGSLGRDFDRPLLENRESNASPRQLKVVILKTRCLNLQANDTQTLNNTFFKHFSIV